MVQRERRVGATSTGKTALETRGRGSDEAATRAASSIGVLASAELDARRAVSPGARSRAASAPTTSITRLRRRDFRDQAADPAAPRSAVSIADLDAARRRRSSSARTCAWKCRCSRTACARPRSSGAKRRVRESERYDVPVPGRRVRRRRRSSRGRRVARRRRRGRCAGGAKSTHRSTCASSSRSAQPTDAQRAAAEALARKRGPSCCSGALAQRHPRVLPTSARSPRRSPTLTGATLGYLRRRRQRAPARTSRARCRIAALGGEPLSRAGRDARDDARVAAARPTCCSAASSRATTSRAAREALDALRAAKRRGASRRSLEPSSLDVARRAAADRRRSPRPRARS